MFGLVSLCGHYLCHPVCLVLCRLLSVGISSSCLPYPFNSFSADFYSVSSSVWLYYLENPEMPYWLFNLDSINIVTGLCHCSNWKSMIPFRVFCAWSASFRGLHIHFVRLTLANGPNVFQGSFNGFHVRLLPVIISDVVQPGIPSCPSQHPHFG